MKYLNSVFMVLLLLTVSFSVSAQEQEAEPKKDVVTEQLRANNPYLVKLQDASKEFIEGVPDEGVKALYLIRHTYGILRSVHTVKKDVGHAVKLCGTENTDLKGDMDARFKQWSDSVTPVLEAQDKKLDGVIKKQSYKKPKDVKAYLKNIDNAADYADKMLDKKVVTTPEACTSLLESMDDTEANIVELLGKTPMPDLDEEGKAVAPNEPVEEALTEGEDENVPAE